MAENLLFEEELAAKALIGQYSPSVVGSRIRRERLAQKLSIRDLAERAHLGKSSIVRLESGAESRPITIVKICAALGLHVSRLGDSFGSESIAVHRSEDERWYEFSNFAAGVLGGLDRPLSQEERHLMVQNGAKNPISLLKSRLGEGKLLPTLIELFEPTETRAHPGEEFVYVLEGSLRLTVNGVAHRLNQGESADFWGEEPHSYAPDGAAPALILSLRVNP